MWVMPPHLVQKQLTEWRRTRYSSMFYVQNGGYQPQAQKELKWIVLWLIFLHNEMETQQYSTPTNGLILYTSLVQNEGPKIRMSTTTNSILYSPYLCSKKWRSLILYWCYLNTLLLSNVLKISQHKTRLNAAPPIHFLSGFWRGVLGKVPRMKKKWFLYEMSFALSIWNDLDVNEMDCLTTRSNLCTKWGWLTQL